MEDLNGAVRRVDALPARSTARGDRELEILVVEVHVDIVRFGEHGDGRSRRVDASLRLRRGDALHAMHAALEAELRVDVLAVHERDALFVAAGRALALREDLDRPSLRLGEAAVHAEEVGGEERGFLTAFTAADLEDDVLLVVRIRGKEEKLDLLFEDAALRLQLGQLDLDELTQLGIGERLFVLFDLLLERAKARERLHERLEIASLLRQLRELVPVGQDVRTTHELV